VIVCLATTLLALAIGTAAAEAAGPPVITEVSPGAGPSVGGTTVTVIGTGFTGATSVKFGGEPAEFTVDSDEQITTVAPPGEGDVEILVTTPEGHNAFTSEDVFRYIPPPFVHAVTKPTGAAGSKVDIMGKTLSGATQVYFGSTPATSFEVKEGEHVLAVVPEGSGTVDVTVVTPKGTTPVVTADRFSYVEAPEFGRCFRSLGLGYSEFSNNSCTAPSTSGGRGWFPLFGNEPIENASFSLAGGSVTLETGPGYGAKIKCSGKPTLGDGEYTSRNTISTAALSLKACKEPKGPQKGAVCQTAGAAAGEVLTSPLQGKLGLFDKGSVEKSGVELSPQSGETFAEFECAGTTVSLRGGVIIEAQSGKMSAKQKWKAVQKGGAQTPDAFVGGPVTVLEARIGAGAYEALGMKVSISQTNAEAVEVSLLV
jgi:hypothetical protein